MMCRATPGVVFGTHVTIIGLIQGLQYVIRIAAVSEIGRGNYIETEEPIIPKPAPSSFSYLSLNNVK